MKTQIERWENEGGKVLDEGIGIPDQSVYKGVRVLTQVLADEHVLFHKLRNYHWNVRGMHFSELHSLFERQYELIATRIDETAERIRQLGYPTPATMTEFLQLTNLAEFPGDHPNAGVMVGNVLEDHEAIVRYMRREIEADESCELDIGTVDFLTGLIRDHEKMAWMLRATLSVVGEPRLQADHNGSTASAEYFPYSLGG